MSDSSNHTNPDLKKSTDTKVDTKNETKNQENFRKNRNYQVAQQCILIALINQYYDVTFSVTRARKTITMPFLKIEKLSKGNTTIDIKNLLKQKITEMYQSDVNAGVQVKTAKRRYVVNKVGECLHLLQKTAEFLGFSFKYATSFTNNVKKLTIIEVSFDGIVIPKDKILKIGADANKALVETFFGQSGNSYTLKRGDTELMSVLFN
ncbi:hypothetical protein EIN_284750 [Entamoeba invadens IP1]|uniref:Uncharacterized protein n=1 Tax=Entamoeba invadens IP1 TaxID=370355 RepID=L7FKQ9_ENTIV|nr:hypothetical protein EIN_284750 [Entamoeba invadens IP1]ELP84889.1 hypothetical protein EIN_284750 [Entamoeba invadens IP1]|eukprot:XP_004184235.1 hypothetical protein EIN_284750 [Entamoeba invadens IP1]